MSAYSPQIQHLTTGSEYPILDVSKEDVMTQGTANPLDDTATQARLSDQVQTELQRLPQSATGYA